MNSKIIENVKSNIKNGMELFDQEAIRRGVEIWRPIFDFPNYEISSFGKVKNVKTGRVLKLMDSDGYKRIGLCKKGKRKIILVHRLVAIAFLSNPDNKTCVDHINNNRTDNNVANLRWVTMQENNFNSSIYTNNTSGTKGVHWDKNNNKWLATISYNRRQIHIGSYKTLEKAKKARQKKATELFGEYINSCEK